MTEDKNLSENKIESPDRAAPVAQEQDAVQSGPSAGQRAIRWIFRLLVVLLLGVALGAGLYYGARSFYRDAIEPLQTLDQRMLALEESVSDLNEDVQADKNAIMEDIADLQGSITVQAEAVASISAQIGRLELQVEDQAQALEEIADLREAVNQLGDDLVSSDEQLQALEDTIQAGELPAERVESSLQLMRVMNLMTRARLWIEQDNYGLAGEDIEAALEIMETLTQETISEGDEQNQLLDITQRLTLALEVLRTNPELAEEGLEIVWKLLIETTAP
jgi:chromosome segregation ATPase